MQMKKALASMLIAAGTIGALATPLSSVADVGAQWNYGPPLPARYESGPAPRHGYVWVPGYWDWRGHHRVWVNGGWVRERPSYAYQRGRWDHVRGRDSDRDGVPDRFDRYPYNPYRR